MTIALISITLLYLIVIGLLIYGFDRVEDFQLKDHNPKLRFSIIIPFRNESKHLPLLLVSIKNLEYPKSMFEIIFVDDASTDNSRALILKFKEEHGLNIILLENTARSKSPKKEAIRLGVNNANEDWIITTDADCILPKYWLDCYDSYIQNNKHQLIIGPVACYNNARFLDRFQALDILSLQASTIGGFGIKKPFLCNGANLAYSKTLFESLQPYEDNHKVASGDDVFLLLKAWKIDKSTVGFLKSNLAVVETSTQDSWNSLVSQRVRWVSKSKYYKAFFPKFIGLTIVMMNALLIVGLISVAFDVLDKRMIFYAFVIKVSLDFLLIFKSSRFFNKETILTSYMASCIIYPFFALTTALVSLKGGYKWKGRKYI